MNREMTTDHFLSTRFVSLTCLQLNLWFFKCISWFTNVFCLRSICRGLSFRTSQTRIENLYPTFNEPTIDPKWIPFIFQNSFSLVVILFQLDVELKSLYLPQRKWFFFSLKLSQMRFAFRLGNCKSFFSYLGILMA